MRYVVIGVSGSGKTTLARQIARSLAAPHIELDALFWERNWQAAPGPVFRGRVQAAAAGNAWVVDGNYNKSRDIVWNRAPHLVWLDYSLPLILGRVVWRTLCRLCSQQELWSGNRQSFLGLFGRNSIVWYALSSYRRHRRRNLALLRGGDYTHLTVNRFSRPQEASIWLRSLRHEKPAAIQ